MYALSRFFSCSENFYKIAIIYYFFPDGSIILKDELDFEVSTYVEVTIELCDSFGCKWSHPFNITLMDAPDAPRFNPNYTEIVTLEDVVSLSLPPVCKLSGLVVKSRVSFSRSWDQILSQAFFKS